MAITKADVIAIAPELSTVSDATWAIVLAHVELEVNAEAWGDYASIAKVYLAAHKATMTLRRGVAGVQSETVGPVSRTYAVSVATDASPFRTTSYGQEYERLQRLVLPTLVVL